MNQSPVVPSRPDGSAGWSPVTPAGSFPVGPVRAPGLPAGTDFQISCVEHFHSSTAKTFMPCLLGLDGKRFLNPHLPPNPGDVVPTGPLCPPG